MSNDLRRALAGRMRIDPDAPTIDEVVRLDQAEVATLFLRDALETQQSDGHVNVKELVEVSKLLREVLLPPPSLGFAGADSYDTALLSDAELEQLERLLRKASGESVEDEPAPPDYAGEVLELREALERANWAAARDEAEISDLKSQLEAAKTPVPEDEIAARLQKLLDEMNEDLEECSE